MLLQVHDELVFESPENEVETAKKLIKENMENAYKTEVPLLVEVGVGENWLEAHWFWVGELESWKVGELESGRVGEFAFLKNQNLF